jgi:hypothetical protein
MNAACMDATELRRLIKSRYLDRAMRAAKQHEKLCRIVAGLIVLPGICATMQR